MGDKSSHHHVNRSFLALGLGEAVARLVGFAATVFAIRTLGASTYGMVGVATAVALYLNRIADFGFELGLGVREIAAEPGFLERVAPSVLGFRSLLSALLALSLAVVGFVFMPQPDGAVLAVHGLALFAVGTSTRWIHLGSDRNRTAALALTAGQLCMALLVLALVRGPGDVATVSGAQVAGDLLAALLLCLALGQVGRRLPLRLEWAVLRPLFPRAWSLVASALLGIVIYNAGLLLLRVLQGTSAVGYYAAGYTLVTFFLNLGIAYNLSLLPSLTRLRDLAADRERLFHTATAQVFAAGLPLAVGGSLLAERIILLLFGSAYRDSAAPFAILIWAIPLNLLRDVPLMALLSGQGERAVFRVTLVSALLSVALNLALIPWLGLVGAALATVLTEAIRMLLATWAARRVGFHLPGPRRFVKAGLATLAMAGGLLALRHTPVWFAVGAGGLFYLGILALVGGIRFEGKYRPVLNV